MNRFKVYEKLYRQQYTALYNFVRTYVGDSDIAKDIIHEVFLTLLERADSLHIEKSLTSYLFTMVRNAALAYIKKERRLVALDEAADLGVFDTHVDFLFEDKKSGKRINDAVNQLPPKCREIFILSRFSNLSYDEIAALKGISKKTIESQITIAFKKLRKLLKPYVEKDND